MSTIKKIGAFLFALSFFFVYENVTSASEIALTNSYGIGITQEEYDNLKELGFSDLAIDQMNEEVFNANKDLVVEAKAEDTKYYEVVEKPKELQTFNLTTNEEDLYVSTELSEEEYFKRVNKAKNEIKAFASTDETKTSYRRLKTSIQIINSSIRLYSDFVWDIIPETRSYDVLTTSFDSSFSAKAASEFGQQLWAYTNPSLGGQYGGNATYAAGSAAYTRDRGGYGVKMNLKDDEPGVRVTELEGYMYFNILLNGSKPKYLNAYGNYSHLKTDDDTSFSFGLDFGGPSISWSGISSSSFDSITTHAQIPY